MKKQIANSLILMLAGVTLSSSAFISPVKAETIADETQITNSEEATEIVQNNNLTVKEENLERDLIETIAPFIFIGFLGAFALVLGMQKTSQSSNN
ncbi:MAG: hypothetical protein QNJ54_10045 [Prochloraceae cyanobacterium]|nr:hypothetical protein [Prochloraceae cyanobacterium]